MNWIKKKYYQAISAEEGNLYSNSDGCTLILSSFKRPKNVKKILAAYMDYALLDEIIIWHNGPEKLDIGAFDEDVKIIESNDLGLASRYAAGLLASNDIVLLQDDDIFFEEESLRIIVNESIKNPERTITSEGKIPHKDNTYGKGIKPGIGEKIECEIHLNRLVCTKREFIPHFFSTLYKTGLSLNPRTGGGEDIVYSYAITNFTGKKPLAVGVSYKNLSSKEAISDRYGNQHANRTDIMKICKQLFEES
jgi:hypothetical protein|tara:strand:+ start:1399 stop:2148 length:750 start_codon:yes stop_codon:yes gene_type:complete